MRQKEEYISFRLILFVPISDNSDRKEYCYKKVGPGLCVKPYAAVMRKFQQPFLTFERVKTGLTIMSQFFCQ